ncbi:hypothetical protein KAJ83_00405 [Marivibrio halodurans]|uniref:Uncharacterized protein n=1 Tax=Marivibrio halodurans TaxID=2039722 RepID=A0A8J7V272_9PROT|nr:hypothetical protein [Marivibrio halodurans]MBP5855454.1 hypothetical protein [Marivibrio halodurans]
MLILITGPDGSGSARGGGAGDIVQKANDAALLLLRRGHMPLVSSVLTRPIVARADEEGMADETRVSLAERLAAHCDACLRLGGASERADAETALFGQAGKPVYHDVNQVPEETG